MPTSHPRGQVTRTFSNLSRRSPAPKNNEPSVSPPATPWLNRILRRHSSITPPTRAELDALPAKERQELIDARRQRPLQILTTLVTSAGVLLGVAFTAYGFSYTAQTLRATQEGQITDRYTKAVEQLASPATDVRLGAIYALQRTANDSSRDRLTIRNVLAAFVRNHDFCSVGQPPKQCDNKPVKNPGATPRVRLATDVHAALTLAPALTALSDAPPDFSRVRFPNVDLTGANLVRANLADANLTGANLILTTLTDADLVHANLADAYLAGTHLADANLTDVNLTGANLTLADLTRTNLTRAYLVNTDLVNTDLTLATLPDAKLPGADLTGADLTGADLTSATLTLATLHNADLTGANLSDADLTGADLTAADLTRANLTGANLTGVKGTNADKIRNTAITNSTTKF